MQEEVARFAFLSFSIVLHHIVHGMGYDMVHDIWVLFRIYEALGNFEFVKPGANMKRSAEEGVSQTFLQLAVEQERLLVACCSHYHEPLGELQL